MFFTCFSTVCSVMNRRPPIPLFERRLIDELRHDRRIGTEPPSPILRTLIESSARSETHGFELIWLPAGLLAAAWPVDRKRALTDCRRRAHGQRQKDAGRFTVGVR
jgi:hypothetical protein